MGLQIETLHDDHLVIFRLEDLSRETIDAWVAAHTAWIESLPTGEPSFVLLDCSTELMAFSPYLRSRATQLIRAFADTPGYMVLLVPNRFWQETMKFFFRSQQRGTHLTTQVMTNRAEAVAWLVEQMERVTELD